MKAKEKRVLRELDLRRRKPGAKSHCIWDAKQPGLCARVRRSGHVSLAFVFSRHGKTIWYTIGAGVLLSDARRIAARLACAAAEGRNPQREKLAQRDAGTFGELARRYVEERAKRRNRSWEQADALVRRHLLPRWGGRIAREITRADVRAAIGAIESPSVANAVWVAGSAVFSFGVKVEVLPFNPFSGIERHKLPPRGRVLSDSELKVFWPLLSPPLRAVLLLGQRPGEVLAMRREHIKDGWWEMPGAPDAKLDWPGTKNKQTNRVWLPSAARKIVDDGDGDGRVFSRRPELDGQMREICARLGVREKVTPHDLRRTWTTRAAELGVTRLVVDRILNHVKRSVTGDVYDHYSYGPEIRRAMERVAERIVALAEGRPASGEVVVGLFPSKV
jgi:integrase